MPVALPPPPKLNALCNPCVLSRQINPFATDSPTAMRIKNRFNVSTFQRASLRDNLNDFFLNRGGSMLAMYDKAPKIALDGLTNVLDGLVAGFTLRSTSR
jgi:hypothetical protein